jgi:transposase
VNTWRLAPVVEALQALRGVQCTVAVTSLAARGARTRVDPPRQLMSDLGLTPSAYASGERRRQGGIPNAGNPPARRALGEGAWASRDPANVSRPLPRRLAPLPKGLQDIRWKAPVRRCQRYRPRRARGPPAPQVVVAIARARAACRGALAQPVRMPPALPHT